MRRLSTITLAVASAALLSVTLLAVRADDDRDERTVLADGTPAATECDEAAVREAIESSDAVAPGLEFEFAHLACAGGFAWAVVDAGPRVDPADAFLRVSDAGVELLDLGTAICTADSGIPPDVAAKIAPPGRDPAGSGDCPTAVDTECSEAAVREAIERSGFVPPDLEFEFLHLACADGFGWAVIDPVDPRFDEADVLLRVSDAGIEVLDLGTSVCTLDFGIPPDVAAKIAPPGRDPAGDCPEAVEVEPRFTG